MSADSGPCRLIRFRTSMCKPARAGYSSDISMLNRSYYDHRPHRGADCSGQHAEDSSHCRCSWASRYASFHVKRRDPVRTPRANRHARNFIAKMRAAASHMYSPVRPRSQNRGQLRAGIHPADTTGIGVSRETPHSSRLRHAHACSLSKLRALIAGREGFSSVSCQSRMFAGERHVTAPGHPFHVKLTCSNATLAEPV
ncbi:hypothetical protein BJ994_003275 [Arthrobacter pigmenti]|uniref:Uncharacterized protein n=1 Tax=Arthrobacter pigmenti TaxID=271432 RepID=A0A846RT21_9MICC|nr:hypothetical protein [Arthrobacter pigmenti]